MKSLTSIFATLVLVGGINFAASAQTADDENTVAAIANTNAVAEQAETEAAMGELNVWPKRSSIKVMIDIEEAQNVTIYNVAGIKVREMKVAKGQSINVESLLPGTYSIVTSDRRKGTFVKEE